MTKKELKKLIRQIKKDDSISFYEFLAKKNHKILYKSKKDIEEIYKKIILYL